jgi:pimeloyl-ACP methyl ester carboxylesterase
MQQRVNIMNSELTSTDRVRHGHVNVDGIRIHWAEMGDPNGALPIVLLHGINDSHLTWSRVAPLLASHRRVLMPDFPGCGLSERPDASYALQWHAHIIASWMALLRIEQADIVGHSFGGGVAQMMLLECPKRLRRVALVSSGGLGREVGFWLRLATGPRVVEHFGQPFMALGTRLALRRACGSFSNDDVAQRSAMNSQRGSARAFARTVRDVIDWRGQTQLFMARAHEIDALPPMAVYFGDRDLLIPGDHSAVFGATVAGAVSRQFLGCGHYLHHEQPDAFVSALCEFLDVAAVATQRPHSRRRRRSRNRSTGRARTWSAARSPST